MRCSTSSLPQWGHTMVPSAYSAGVKVFEKDPLQAWQMYSNWGMVASVPGSYTRILGFTTDLIQRPARLRTELFHNGEVCVLFQMTPPRLWMSWILSLSRRRTTGHLGRALDVRFVVGRPAKTICGLDTCGHSWNTFNTGGVCPACLYRWISTQCLSCAHWSPHSGWYPH